MPTLYDAYGRPVSNQTLKRDVDFPVLAGLSQPWNESIASGLTPAALGGLLQNAASGDVHAYLTLAEEMEERDAHFGSVLRTRRLAVQALPITVEAASDAAPDQKMADAVRELMDAPAMSDLVAGLLDALGKGFAACEIEWTTGSSRWSPTAYHWRDPRLFAFDAKTQRELRLADPASPEGHALPPFKFVQHRPQLKSGLPIRGGLARMAAWMYLVKAYSITDWVAFVEIFGQPLRVGRYGPSATPEDRNKLLQAVANIGAEAAGIIPESMQIEFIQAAKTGSNDIYERLARWADQQVSKAVLGQTASSEGTPGKLGSEDLQAEVRQDLLKADGKALAATLERDLVRPFVDLNFGPQVTYPSLVIQPLDPEDTAALTEALSKLVPLGLKVEQSVVRDKLGLPDPEEGAELLQPPNPQVAQNHQGNPPATALNAALTPVATPLQDPLDALAAEALEDWEEVMGPAVLDLVEALEKAKSYEEAQAALAALAGQGLDLKRFQEALTRLTFLSKAHGAGDPSGEE